MTAHPRPRPRRAYLHGVLIGLGVWAILALLFTAGSFRTFDLKLLDMRLRLRGEQPGNDRIALVEIDDATIGAYGRWPIPRDTYALLLTVVEEAGAYAVGFDLLFLGEDSTDPRFDPLLAQVTGSYDNVVHAVGFTTGEPTSLGASITSEAGEMLRRHAGETGAVKAPTAMSVALPYPELLSAASGLGHVMVAVDPDGVVRRVPLFVNYEGRLYPSLVMRLAWVGRAWKGGGARRGSGRTHAGSRWRTRRTAPSGESRWTTKARPPSTSRGIGIRFPAHTPRSTSCGGTGAGRRIACTKRSRGALC